MAKHPFEMSMPLFDVVVAPPVMSRRPFTVSAVVEAYVKVCVPAHVLDVVVPKASEIVSAENVRGYVADKDPRYLLVDPSVRASVVVPARSVAKRRVE